MFAHFLQQFCQIFFFLQKKKRSKGCQSLVLQPLLENNINQKNGYIMSKSQINLQKFLQWHILQNILHFRPREEAVTNIISKHTSTMLIKDLL